ncbi:MAG: hypothetical protein EXR27_02055 [Betaproteobacteria bacterium]|nr:hypothetical protein [Betaproteobacteria bacterium]
MNVPDNLRFTLTHELVRTEADGTLSVGISDFAQEQLGELVCIFDLRSLRETRGIHAEDVAKRLIDYGFHAPTLSFPVPETLMFEPTESESRAELDRFCEAMIAIHGELDRIRSGAWDRADNPLKNAPHTAEELAGAWTHPYSRETAAYPLTSLRLNKYWPPVKRVDQVHGDRHFFCGCPPPAAWAVDNGGDN